MQGYDERMLLLSENLSKCNKYIYIYLVRNIIGEKIPKLHHSILSTLVSINKKNTCINDQPCSTKELLKPIKRTV